MGRKARIPGTGALLALMTAGCMVAGAQAKDAANNGSTTNIPGALPGIHLVSPVPDGEWTLPAGDYANTRYSPLSQINTSNVQNLKVVATASTGIPHGHEGQPLVVNGTLYIVTPYPNNLIALDITKPGFPQKWIFRPNPDLRSVGIACCDVVNRGASYADGEVIYNTLDAQTVAVDAKTGQKVWETQVGDIRLGETVTMAPLVVKNVVLVGDSGGELGVRGKLTALDVKTGKILWRAWNSGSDEDARIGPDFHPYYAKDRGKDLGIKTWTPGQWKMGGGTIWGWISYDPETNLIFYGTGNPGVWNPDMRLGDNKWSCTIWARDPETGYAKWAYQISAHDAWDYDEIMENIPVDMPWQGKERKLLLHPGRTGFMFVFDRETGQLLSAEKYEPVNWANDYNLTTGLPSENPDKRPHFGKYAMDICPSSTGAKDFIPSAFSPRTGYLYIPAHNTCMDYEGTAVNYIAGTPYLGASVRMYPGPGGYQGELVAWDVANAKKVWSIKDDKFPVYSGVLATGGDVVFYGTMEGWFRAVDAHTGKILWQFKTSSGIVGDPITFTGPDGKQYVAIYSGIGGWMGASALPSISTDDPYATLGANGAMRDIKAYTQPGDTMYVFSF
ncbi:MAG TPA: PQQ-dependent dehydrogenase, methanol/ethanol family [Acidobacteriaceae bacterium]|jgi:PQQ-dependent dehydrogenase (methanol/ethanol family)|nr:PQQ-dependent dehydrogenase, methanol/ethanol family [Acidobacteriaceae bacterium]